ncbi:MAG: glycoside hydrolase family 3 N-terminal domain-containing protein [Actinomycetales bacterium]
MNAFFRLPPQAITGRGTGPGQAHRTEPTSGLTRRRLLGLAVAMGLTGCAAGGSDDPTSSTGSATDSGNPPARLPWGPTEEQLAQASALVAEWPDDKLAGQVLVLTYDGTEPEQAADAVSAVHAAGVILMKPNIVDTEKISQTAIAVQQALADDDRDYPAVITVDQEGGIVARLSGVVPDTPSFMSAGAAVAGDSEAGAAAVRSAAVATGNALRSLGFTWVFAPSADVTIGPQDPTIGSRSAGDDPRIVSEAVTAAVTGYQDSSIVCSAKHFPGHGSVTSDSHTTLPVQSATLETLVERDLPPFVAASAAGVPVLMMSHIAVDAFEPGVPCTLSPAAYAIARKECDFSGVICTDAMNMDAIAKRYGAGDAAAQAVIAGADLVLMPADPTAAHAAILAALADGSLSRARLEEAAARVIALQRWQAEGASTGPIQTELAALSEASQGLSAAAVTLISGECGTLVSDAVRVSGGTEADRDAFTTAARAAGLATDSGPQVVLVTPSAPRDGDIVVAVDTPYVLARCSAEKAAFALYGRTPGAFAALLDVLSGKAAAPGRLPVEVDGVSAVSCPQDR